MIWKHTFYLSTFNFPHILFSKIVLQNAWLQTSLGKLNIGGQILHCEKRLFK